MRRIRFSSIADIFEAYPSLLGRIKVQPSADEPIAFLEKALRDGRSTEAIEVCPFLLPRREAIWWGGRCIAEREGGLSAEDRHDWEVSIAWVRHTDEKRRALAHAVAEAGDPERPETWLAWAVVWSGGPMEPGEPHSVPAPPDLYGKALNNAMVAASARLSPVEARSFADRCLRTALEIAVSETDVGKDAEHMVATRREARDRGR